MHNKRPKTTLHTNFNIKLSFLLYMYNILEENDTSTKLDENDTRKNNLLKY